MTKAVKKVTAEEYGRHALLKTIVPVKLFKRHGLMIERGEPGDGVVTLKTGPGKKHPACSFTLDQEGVLSKITCHKFRWPSRVRVHAVSAEAAKEMIQAFFGREETMFRLEPIEIEGDPRPWEPTVMTVQSRPKIELE